jgi:hypothetical protein
MCHEKSVFDGIKGMVVQRVDLKKKKKKRRRREGNQFGGILTEVMYSYTSV